MPAGLPGPDALEVGARTLRAGGVLHHTLAVTGYPREVGPGWLQPLLDHPGPIDVALHLEPVATVVAAERLRRQLARLESSQRLDATRGRLDDPQVEAATHDAQRLARRLATGEGRLFRVGLYITVRGHTQAELDAAVARVQGLLGSLLLDAHPTTFRALQGWITTLPLGLDQLRLHRTMDTAAVAACFPFASADLPPPVTGGMLIGRNPRHPGTGLLGPVGPAQLQPGHPGPLRRRQELPGQAGGAAVAVPGRPGPGRRPRERIPAARRRRSAARTCAWAHPGVHLNPLDLGPEPDALTRRALFAHTLVAVLLGRPPGPRGQRGAGPGGARRLRGPGDHQRPAHPPPPRPPPSDLAHALERTPTRPGRCSPHGSARYVTGSYRGLFEQPTSTHPDGHLLVVSLRDLPEELKPAGTLLALDTLWRTVTDPQHRRRRLVVIDEAWWLAQQPAGARFLYRLAKSARKHWCALTVVTQDAADLLASELGQAVVANAATQVLLGQAPQAIDRLTSAFALTEGERQLLLAARVGEGLLAGPGGQRAWFCAQASPAEHGLVTTDPRRSWGSRRSVRRSRRGDRHRRAGPCRAGAVAGGSLGQPRRARHPAGRGGGRAGACGSCWSWCRCGWRAWRRRGAGGGGASSGWPLGPAWSRSCPHPRSSRPRPRRCGEIWPGCCACAARWIPGPMSASSSRGPPAG